MSFDWYTLYMIDDLSKQLRRKVISLMSDTEKLELNLKEALELSRLYPEYAVKYFRFSFNRKEEERRGVK